MTRAAATLTNLVKLAVAAMSLLAGAARAQSPGAGPAFDVDRPALAGAVGDQTVPAVAHLAGDLFVAVWRTALWEGEVRAARLTAGGEVRDPRGVVLPGLESTGARPAVASGGGNVLVVSAGEGKLQAMRLSGAAGGDALVPGVPVLLATAAPEELAAATPAVSWDGTGFWVAWSQGPAGIQVVRLDARGQLPPAATPLRLSPTPGHPALVREGARTLAAWSTVDPPPTPGRVAIRAARLDASGALLDGTPLEVGQLPGTRAGPITLASNGTLSLAAAAGEGGPEGSAVVGAFRLPSSGGTLDATAILLGTLKTPAEGGPTAIWNGSRFLVLWGEVSAPPSLDPTVPHHVAPEGRLVSSDGAVSALGLPSLGASGEQPVATAGDGGAPALLLMARPPGGKGDLDIRGVRLTTEGGAEGTDFLVSAGLNWQGHPALAASGPGASGQRRLLVAWEDARSDRQNGDIHASLLDETGAPLDPTSTPLATGTATQRAPAVAWDGQVFQVVWKEQGRGLMASRVGLDGKVVDRPAVLVPGTGGRQQTPQVQPVSVLSDPVICGDDGGAVLVWSVRREPEPASPPRAELRVARLAPGTSVKDAASVVLLATYDVSTPPVMRMACSADAALLVWTGLHEMDRSDLPDLQMALVPRRGPLSPRVTLLERGAADEGPAVASDGRGFLVAWRPRQVNGARVAIYGTRVDPSGVGLDRPARELGSLNAGHRVNAYWDGVQYVLVGIQSLAVNEFQLRGRRVRPDLGAVDPDWFAIDSVSSRRGTGSLPVTMGLGGGAALVTFDTFADDDATGNQRLRSRRLLTPPLDPSLVAPPDAGVSADAAPGDALNGSNDGRASAQGARLRGGGCDCRLERRRPSSQGAALILSLILALAVFSVGRSRRRRRTDRVTEAPLDGDRREVR